MITSNEISEIAKSLSKLQGSMRPAVKNATNPFLKNKYTSLFGVWDSIRELLEINGLCVLQDAKSTEAGASVTTRICHSSGQWIEFGPLDLPVSKKDAQAFGSAVSYARRYALAACLGVVSDDDDGERAVQEIRHPKKITPDQEGEIYTMLIGHDEIKNGIEKFLISNGAKRLTDLASDNYDKIKRKILKSIDDKSKSVGEKNE